jgi:hypothetical protein
MWRSRPDEQLKERFQGYRLKYTLVKHGVNLRVVSMWRSRPDEQPEKRSKKMKNSRYFHLKEPEVTLNQDGKYLVKHRVFRCAERDGDLFEELFYGEKYVQKIEYSRVYFEPAYAVIENK